LWIRNARCLNSIPQTNDILWWSHESLIALKHPAFLKTKDRTIEKPMKKSCQTIGVLIRPLLVDMCVIITERGPTTRKEEFLPNQNPITFKKRTSLTPSVTPHQRGRKILW
jgi:hypothetical protein